MDEGGQRHPPPSAALPLGKKPLYRRPKFRSGRVRKISPPTGIFSFSFFPFCTPFFTYIFLNFAFLSLTYNTWNTNIHSPGGIRTRNPSRRAATDLRLRPRDHRKRLDSRTVQSVASRHTDWVVAAQHSYRHFTLYIVYRGIHVGDNIAGITYLTTANIRYSLYQNP